MRQPMWMTIMSLMAVMAIAEESPVSDKSPVADPAEDKAEPKTVTEAKPQEPEEIKLPPGFKVKKHGDFTLYCIKGKPTGTRFPTEDCYDEAQLRDYLLAREQANREFDQRRAICSACSAP